MNFRLVFCFSFFLFLFSSCNFAEREREIQKRLQELSFKEQELTEKEKELLLREEEILNKEKFIDSSAKDSNFVYNDVLPGLWNVKMVCTETTCPGSAVGDTKSETWDIHYQDRLVIARVLENNKLARIYSGYYNGNMLQLNYEGFDTNPEQTTLMTVRLKLTDKGQLEGEREISRPEKCRIIYSLKLNKQ